MLKMCLRLLAVLAVCLCTATQAQSDLFQLSPKRSDNGNGVARYCGERLSNMLRNVCRGTYNTMFKKSSQDAEPEEDNLWPAQEDAEESDVGGYPGQGTFPFLARPSVGGLLSGAVFRRRTRGVYDECCRKGCNLHELKSYCGNRRR